MVGSVMEPLRCGDVKSDAYESLADLGGATDGDAATTAAVEEEEAVGAEEAAPDGVRATTGSVCGSLEAAAAAAEGVAAGLGVGGCCCCCCCCDWMPASWASGIRDASVEPPRLRGVQIGCAWRRDGSKMI